MERLATTPGLYPLPNWAKRKLTDLKGKQKSSLISGDETEAVTEIYDQARHEIVELQRDAGLDRVVEGQLRWDDMLCHPLAVHDAVETGGLLRYYDNNNFYREMVVQDRLSFDGDLATDLEAAAEQVGAESLQAVIPGPYSLARLATDEHYGDETSFLEGLGSFLAGEVEAFPPVRTLFLLEPSLAVDPPTDTGPVIEAIDEVADAVEETSTDVVVHSYWGVPPEPVYAALRDARIDGLGFDLVTSQEAAQSRAREFGAPDTVALGVVDGQNTLVESTAGIDAVVDSFAGAADGVETGYLTFNTEPFYLPMNRFEEKVGVLGRVADPPEVAR